MVCTWRGHDVRRTPDKRDRYGLLPSGQVSLSSVGTSRIEPGTRSEFEQGKGQRRAPAQRTRPTSDRPRWIPLITPPSRIALDPSPHISWPECRDHDRKRVQPRTHGLDESRQDKTQDPQNEGGMNSNPYEFEQESFRIILRIHSSRVVQGKYDRYHLAPGIRRADLAHRRTCHCPC